MPLLGRLAYSGDFYVYMETSSKKNSRLIALVAEQDPTSDQFTLDRKTDAFYRAGGKLDHNYVLGMIDPIQKMEMGSSQLLNAIYTSINKVVVQAKIQKNTDFYLGLETYKDGDSEVRYRAGKIVYAKIKTPTFSLEAEYIDKLEVRPRALNQKLVPVDSDRKLSRYNTSTFVDASWESLIARGFKMDWYEVKKYYEIHSVEDFDKKVVTRFCEELDKYKANPDFPYFIVSIDFESTGVNPYSTLCDYRDKAVYFSISFADHESFGVFLDMEHFDNADIAEIGKRMTNMFARDPIVNREITVDNNGTPYTYMRDDIRVAGHNFMIDRRFGLTVEADVWFDFCSLMLSFNLEPFHTKGKNGLKHIVTKMLGIEYAELGEICGPKNKGMFRYLSDIRVITMYGCADTDLHRLVLKKMITIIKNATEYYGVDHVEQHYEYESIYMNSKASNDYEGHRVNYAKFKELYDEYTRILNLYYSFMSQYIGRVKAYRDYELAVINASRYNIDLPKMSKKDIDTAPPYLVKKWSGKELMDALYSALNYPILYYTTQNKKSKLEGRKFTPQPAINSDSVDLYLEDKALVSKERIAKAFEETKSLEDLKYYAMYLAEDYIDPKTKKVLVSKDEFNSAQHPFYLLLRLTAPYTKALSAELKPVSESNSEYRFGNCNMASAVTKRDLHPFQTVSGSNKWNYIPYDDDYNYCAVDQSAVEIRILNGLSKDKRLITPLNNPEKDSHTETASLMYQRPPHTIDKKTRKGVKELAFGIPYGKGEFTSCKSLFGNSDPDSMAKTYELFKLYKTKLSSVIKVLEETRDLMDEPVNMPADLREYLELNPEKDYGRMMNAFGYCQHIEIRRGVEWFRAAARRKAGNFIIQGFAAILLRLIYNRLFKAFWAKGWIQNKMVRIHLTVHDEIDMSYHKSLNPLEFLDIVDQALTVQREGFPTFYVGINFGRSWGEAKDDASELPVLLVQQLRKAYRAGKYDGYDFGDHIEFFAEKRLEYKIKRVEKELRKINENRNVYSIDMMDEIFENYTVRAMMADLSPKKKPMIIGADSSHDPTVVMTSALSYYLAKYMSTVDSRKQYIFLDGKGYLITPDMADKRYASLDDFKKGIEYKEEKAETISTELEYMSDDFEFEFDDVGFDLNDNFEADEEEFVTDGIVDLDTTFIMTYAKRKENDVEKLMKFDSTEDRVQAQWDDSAKSTYETFRLANNRVMLQLDGITSFTTLKKFCVGKASTSKLDPDFFVRVNGRLYILGKFSLNNLELIDKFLKEKGGVVT